MKALHMIAFILLVIGGLNWGLVGAFDFNLVGSIFGDQSAISTIIYILVGLSAIYLAITHKHDCKTCQSGSSAPAMSQGM